MIQEKINLEVVTCKTKIIDYLLRYPTPIGKRKLMEELEEGTNTLNDSLYDLLNFGDELIGSGVINKEHERFTLKLDTPQDEERLITELIMDTLWKFKALSPRDLSDCIKKITGDKFGEQRILQVANLVLWKKGGLYRRGVRRNSLFRKDGDVREKRDFFYLIFYSEYLDIIFEIYTNSKKRKKFRERLLGVVIPEDIDPDDEVEVVEEPEPRPNNLIEFIEHIKTYKNYKEQIVAVKEVDYKPPVYGQPEFSLTKKIMDYLIKENKFPLYLHQVDAIKSILNNNNVVVATPNASGKTLCYTVPIFELFLKDMSSRFLYIVPTKALGQDQLKRFKEFKSGVGIDMFPATYTGDETKSLNEEEKKDIRENAHILLTNPDEIHYGILPHHTNWAEFFKNLKIVILDEVHIYKGVFGSHVANVIRRLRRICNYYGSNPQFVCVSATIANPLELAEKLIGLQFQLVDANGAPSWKKYFVFWNTPLSEEGNRMSPYTEALFLFKEHVKHDLKNITFTNSRKIAELLLKRAREDLSHLLWPKIQSYRAGFLAEHRREIEQGLFRGDLIGVTSTNALELGIDIGNLDATILVGYPGSIASTWQQANRAGRMGKDALITLIALNDPLNQYLINKPEEFFKKSFENVVINPENEYVLMDHLPCAAMEIPLELNDVTFGKNFTDLIEALKNENIVEVKDNKVSCKIKPHQKISIRGAAYSKDTFYIHDLSREKNSLIGTSEKYRAFRELHEGAIYLHQGEDYYVQRLDLDLKKAFVQPINTKYFTEPVGIIRVKITKTEEEKDMSKLRTGFGDLSIIETVTGFVEIETQKNGDYAVIGKKDLHLPNTYIKTTGFWLSIPETIQESMEEEKFEAGLHAIEHLLVSMLPLYAICERFDIRSVSYLTHADVNSSCIFIYDAVPGGVGLSEKGFENIDKLLTTCYEVISKCPCHDGCPSCIHSPFCERRNEQLNKNSAIEILRLLIY